MDEDGWFIQHYSAIWSTGSYEDYTGSTSIGGSTAHHFIWQKP